MRTLSIKLWLKIYIENVNYVLNNHFMVSTIYIEMPDSLRMTIYIEMPENLLMMDKQISFCFRGLRENYV
jgi:hypothetical protein